MVIMYILLFLIYIEYYYIRDCEYCYIVVFFFLLVVRFINNVFFGVDNFRLRGNYIEK